MQITPVPVVPAKQVEAPSVHSLATLTGSYSTTVEGKSYSADVSQTSGGYVATAAYIPPISASGTTVLNAENNLKTRISVLA
jgi:hypothetical protein